MNREEVIYRPPFEANSLLLIVTHGCSHNECSFCTMYKDIPFSVEPMESVKQQLAYAQKYYPGVNRVFLESGDAFALSAAKLAEIAELIHKYLPNVACISAYASIKNIMDKTDEELTMLRRLGFGQLNVGVESGLDEALTRMNKGYTAEEAKRELIRLRYAGMDYGANIIFGGAGRELWRENALATAELLNETRPYLIFTGTQHYAEGSKLYEEIQSGDFHENTFGEYLDEEQLLIEQLALDECLFFGLHPSNVVTMQGYLSDQKPQLLEEVEKTRTRLARKLDQVPVRAGEGAIIA